MRPKIGPPEGRARRLPIPAPPALNEATESYLRRLAHLNHIGLTEIKTHLGLHPNNGTETLPPASLKRLAVVTGYTSDQLIRVLPELDRRYLDPTLFSLTRRTLCTGCTRRHRGGQPWGFYPEHVHLCVKHRLWVVGRDYDRRGLLDVSTVPDVLTTQRKHRRLAQQYGTLATGYAVRVARDIWDNLTQMPFHTSVQRIMASFTTNRTRFMIDEPEYLAATYPAVIDTAALLVSPHWRRIAANPSTRETFYREAGQRLLDTNHPYRPGRGDPLADWIDGIAEEKAEQRRILHGLLNSFKERPSMDAR